MGTIVTEAALVESRAVRAATLDRVDALDKVKALALLPDNLHVTTEMVASYYEVDLEVIKAMIRRHRDELVAAGMQVLRGEALVEFERYFEYPSIDLAGPGGAKGRGGRRALALFDRRAVLNVGQMLRDSDIAKRVRSYLLDVEERATPDQRLAAIEQIEVAKGQIELFGIARQHDLVDREYAEGRVRLILARATGDEPDIDPMSKTITASEFLEGKVSRADLPSARTRLGRAVSDLYRARYGKAPYKEDRPVDGAYRPVSVYTRRDEDLFVQAWAKIAHHYMDDAA